MKKVWRRIKFSKIRPSNKNKEVLLNSLDKLNYLSIVWVLVMEKFVARKSNILAFIFSGSYFLNMKNLVSDERLVLFNLILSHLMQFTV